ncbi:MAG: hypothetical protein HPY89_01675 [Pelotomaculum sp.]|nr:hypothetical protein [Pelotomaculum sp.]
MDNNQLKGKFVPDKNGKLRPVLKLTDYEISVLRNCPSSLIKQQPWYTRAWNWVRKRIL